MHPTSTSTHSYCCRDRHGCTMQSIYTRAAAAVMRSSALPSVPAAATTRAAAVFRLQSVSGEACKLRPQPQQQRQRSLATERLAYGIKVTEDMKVSDAVRRVLSIENSDMPQKKRMLKRLEMEKWQRHVTDTGSPECQIAALTVRINALHDLVNSKARKDFSCQRGYVKLLARRRKMLAYLKRTDFDIYRRVALQTGLR